VGPADRPTMVEQTALKGRHSPPADEVGEFARESSLSRRTSWDRDCKEANEVGEFDTGSVSSSIGKRDSRQPADSPGACVKQEVQPEGSTSQLLTVRYSGRILREPIG
jgi:hypothetical protein